MNYKSNPQNGHAINARQMRYFECVSEGGRRRNRRTLTVMKCSHLSWMMALADSKKCNQQAPSVVLRYDWNK